MYVHKEDGKNCQLGRSPTLCSVRMLSRNLTDVTPLHFGYHKLLQAIMGSSTQEGCSEAHLAFQPPPFRASEGVALIKGVGVTDVEGDILIGRVHRLLVLARQGEGDGGRRGVGHERYQQQNEEGQEVHEACTRTSPTIALAQYAVLVCTDSWVRCKLESMDATLPWVNCPTA